MGQILHVSAKLVERIRCCLSFRLESRNGRIVDRHCSVQDYELLGNEEVYMKMSVYGEPCASHWRNGGLFAIDDHGHASAGLAATRNRTRQG